MKTSQRAFLSGLIMAGLASLVFAQDNAAPKVQRKEAPPAETRARVSTTNVAAPANFPVICYLERRGHNITVKSGPKGAVYSAKTSDGKVLFENLSTEELRAQAPDLHQFVTTAVAGSKGKSSVVIDASLRSDAPR